MLNEENKIAQLTQHLKDLCSLQENLIEVNNLFLECIQRIASGKTKDPRFDALKTLRGASIFAIDGMEILGNQRVEK